jgi:hypothetical protein
MGCVPYIGYVINRHATEKKKKKKKKKKKRGCHKKAQASRTEPAHEEV